MLPSESEFQSSNDQTEHAAVILEDGKREMLSVRNDPVPGRSRLHTVPVSRLGYNSNYPLISFHTTVVITYMVPTSAQAH